MAIALIVILIVKCNSRTMESNIFFQGSSLAMIGRKGARSGSTIMRYDVEGEGGVIVVNILSVLT